MRDMGMLPGVPGRGWPGFFTATVWLDDTHSVEVVYWPLKRHILCTMRRRGGYSPGATGAASVDVHLLDMRGGVRMLRRLLTGFKEASTATR